MKKSLLLLVVLFMCCKKKSDPQHQAQNPEPPAATTRTVVVNYKSTCVGNLQVGYNQNQIDNIATDPFGVATWTRAISPSTIVVYGYSTGTCSPNPTRSYTLFVDGVKKIDTTTTASTAFTWTIN